MKGFWRRAAMRSRAAWLAFALIVGCLIALGVLALTDSGSQDQPLSGAELFEREFTVEEGLGPLFNEEACSACHREPAIGGVGRDGLATVTRIGRLNDGIFDAMVGRGGPFAHARAISELGADCDRTAGIPAGANVTSVRNTPQLFGSGLIDAIPDEAIRAQARRQRGTLVTGRPNLVSLSGGRERLGRFGWKADVATLEQFVAEALRNEIGVTSSLAPGGPPPRGSRSCKGESPDSEVDRALIAALTDFVAALPAPEPVSLEPAGARVFRETGCAACHTPTLDAGSDDAHLYSDLLLHDMGPALDDRVAQGAARGDEWRTAPLWGLADRPRFLHDGRAETLVAAILAHGGEADRARERFRSLSHGDRRQLLSFLATR